VRGLLGKKNTKTTAMTVGCSEGRKRSWHVTEPEQLVECLLIYTAYNIVWNDFGQVLPC